MQFKFQVQPSVDFLFNPTDLVVFVPEGKESREMVDGVEMVKIQTVLSEFRDSGSLVETETHLLPVAVLQAITGFDVETMKPVINASAVGEVLAGFNLELSPEAAAQLNDQLNPPVQP